MLVKKCSLGKKQETFHYFLKDRRLLAFCCDAKFTKFFCTLLEDSL